MMISPAFRLCPRGLGVVALLAFAMAVPPAGAEMSNRRGRIGENATAPVGRPLVALAPQQPEEAEEEENEIPPVGYLVDVPLPLEGQSYQRLRRRLLRLRESEKRHSHPRAYLILRFAVPQGQEAYGQNSEFGASFELAEMLSDGTFSGLTTVAFIPQSLRGQVLLPVLACDESIAAQEAELGPAHLGEEEASKTILQAYEEIATRKKSAPEALARKLVDPATALWKVETESGTRLVAGERLEPLKAEEEIVGDPEELIPAGQPGVFSGTEARRLGWIDYLADTPTLLARAIGIPPETLQVWTDFPEEGRSVRIDVIGAITADRVSQWQRQIEAAIGGDDGPPASFVCLWIDSAGGSLSASLQLAGYLTADIDPREVRTVAYVPEQARSDGALIALACHELVMTPGAILGGEGAGFYEREAIDDARRTLAELFSQSTQRSWSLPLAMIDPELTVHRYTRNDDPLFAEYFCEAELEEQPNSDAWRQQEKVTTDGEPFETDGDDAVDYWLADQTVENFAEYKQLYGLADDPTLLKPGWADKLIRALASPSLATILLLLGFGAIWFEMQSPGLGIGGFMAAFCFLLFFWSNYLGGTAGWLEAILFLAGVASIMMEIFVIPGFGVFGVGGILAIIASLVLAGQTFILPRNSYQFEVFLSSLTVMAVSGLGGIMMLLAGAEWMHRHSKPTDNEQVREAERLAWYDHLLGQTGVTVTPLVPAGRARFGEEVVSVVADGDLIDPHQPVKVVKVHGNRIVVEAAEEAD
jgi:membrane-bound ClpP family serine protease